MRVRVCMCACIYKRENEQRRNGNWIAKCISACVHTRITCAHTRITCAYTHVYARTDETQRSRYIGLRHPSELFAYIKARDIDIRPI